MQFDGEVWKCLECLTTLEYQQGTSGRQHVEPRHQIIADHDGEID